MLLSKIVEQYLANLPVGIVLEDSQVMRNLRRAVRFYCGYATLKSAPSEAELFVLSFVEAGLPAPLFPVGDVHTPIDESESELPPGQDFDLSASELAILGPLWRLYNELENAQTLEASRSQGLDVYGRATSEVEADIRDKESLMPSMCFMEPVVSI